MTENEWAAVIPEPPDDLTAVVDKRGNVWHRAQSQYGNSVLPSSPGRTWCSTAARCGVNPRHPSRSRQTGWTSTGCTGSTARRSTTPSTRTRRIAAVVLDYLRGGEA